MRVRYFLDTEFYEKPEYMELISIGMVGEDGRTYYAENALFDWRLHDPSGPFDVKDTWLWDNVHPHVLDADERKLPRIIAEDIIAFVGDDPNPEFWAYFADYDWVNFCWLFGRMLDLPSGFPKWCRDLKQLMWHLEVQRSALPVQVSAEHNALEDAKWNLRVWEYLDNLLTVRLDETAMSLINR